ncbi:MAG: SDR family oxidoreductase [Bacteroidia bacterium]|nr:SDR family oxidoreductase [Bacteroidia bacterium]
MSKKILITGASGAFGSLTCKSLQSKGYQLVGTMRSTSGKNADISAELRAAGIQLVEMDVTDDASVNAGIAKALELLGGLDIVFNNAGIGSNGIQELFSVEDMKRVYEVNVFGVQRLMRAVLPHFRKQGKGTILHTSSCIGRVTVPFLAMYSSSKYALESMVEGYRAELSPFGIENCIIEPGGFPTTFMGAMIEPSDPERAKGYGEMVHAPTASIKAFHQYMESSPMQRPQRVADAVVDLLELPFGKKPFRTVVDFMALREPIEAYNESLDKTTRAIYQGNGIENMLSLNKA